MSRRTHLQDLCRWCQRHPLESRMKTPRVPCVRRQTPGTPPGTRHPRHLAPRQERPAALPPRVHVPDPAPGLRRPSPRLSPLPRYPCPLRRRFHRSHWARVTLKAHHPQPCDRTVVQLPLWVRRDSSIPRVRHPQKLLLKERSPAARIPLVHRLTRSDSRWARPQLCLMGRALSHRCTWRETHPVAT